MHYRIFGLLVVESPVSISAAQTEAVASGRRGLRISAASLRGALRERLWTSDPNSPWGSPERRGSICVSEACWRAGTDTHGLVSTVRIAAVASEAGQGLPHTHVIPRGEQFDFQLSFDRPRPGELTELLTALRSGFTIGLWGSRGFGRVRVQELRVTREISEGLAGSDIEENP